MRLSPHFLRSEFACPCGCGRDTVDAELLKVLEEIRTAFNAPIKVNSGHRCPGHNAAVGGEPDSQHLHGRAADIVVRDVTPGNVRQWLFTAYPTRLGIGKAQFYTHVDTRSGPAARWTYPRRE